MRLDAGDRWLPRAPESSRCMTIRSDDQSDAIGPYSTGTTRYTPIRKHLSVVAGKSRCIVEGCYADYKRIRPFPV